MAQSTRVVRGVPKDHQSSESDMIRLRYRAILNGKSRTCCRGQAHGQGVREPDQKGGLDAPGDYQRRGATLSELQQNFQSNFHQNFQRKHDRPRARRANPARVYS